MAGNAHEAVAGGGPLITALSQLATRVQRNRTTDRVLQTAGEGLLKLGMRMVVFQIAGNDLVLRYLSTVPQRRAAIENELQRPVRGLRAPGMASCAIVSRVITQRSSVYAEDLHLFVDFLRAAVAYDDTHLEADETTAGVSNGVVAPLFFEERPWGVLEILSDALGAEDAAAVSLFSSQVASALEVAESIELLEQTNEHLTRAQNELIKRERLAALGELAAVMAHEVRNPLAVLFNSIASLRRTLGKPQGSSERATTERLLTIAGEEADRLNGIVNDLLDFANPRLPRFEATSLPALVEEVATSARKLPQAAEVVVRTDVKPKLPAVQLDPRMIRQALFNVVMNALHAMSGHGTLQVSVMLDGDDFVRITVSDSGPGISQAIAERVFEPFFTTRSFGTGLGLAVVKRIVEMHHGSVSVEPLERGTTLALRLPLDQVPEADAPAGLLPERRPRAAPPQA